jgi:hypothetical protein
VRIFVGSRPAARPILKMRRKRMAKSKKLAKAKKVEKKQTLSISWKNK